MLYVVGGCGNSCVNSPEDGPVGPKLVEIRRYMNKIATVTSVGFSFRIQVVTFIKQPFTSFDCKNWCMTSDVLQFCSWIRAFRRNMLFPGRARSLRPQL